MKRTSHSYYVVMEDFGKRGMEAVVTPEITRRAVVAFIAHGNYRDIVFIHHVDGLFVEDVTAELTAEAAVVKTIRAALTGGLPVTRSDRGDAV